MSTVVHFKHVSVDPNADDSPSKAKVQRMDMSLGNEGKTGCKNKDGKMPDSIQDYSSSRSAKQTLAVNEDEPQNFSAGFLETAYENSITTEFLNSVRNMNVEEVTATLHKVAAANPAFRGFCCVFHTVACSLPPSPLQLDGEENGKNRSEKTHGS